MSSISPQRIEELFLLALELPSGDLPAFIDQHLGDDADARSRLQSLLDADAAAGGDDFLKSNFMQQKAPDPDQTHVDVPDRAQTVGSEIRFQILRHHKQGGLGEVLLAYDRDLRREVAVKQIKPKWQSNEEARQRFVQEAEVTGRLEHPGVVPVYAMGTWEDGREYYAMRYIEGDTYGEVIQRYHAALSNDAVDQPARQRELRNLLNRFVDVCNTIDYAHNKQVLHRDIKPSNIMVGPYGETLVLDWGLAKLLDVTTDESMTAGLIGDKSSGSGSTPTQVGGRVGTPQYMSPEQAAGQLDEVGVRTDIYLLGATLYEILTGQPPHHDDSISKLLERVARGELTPPRQILSGIPAALEAICLKAMQADSAHRYTSAALLAADVESWLADDPVEVHRDSLPVRLSRWVRRHRTAATSAAVAAILLTVGSVAGSLIWDIQRTKQRRLESETQAKETMLRSEREQRLVELRAMAGASAELADAELKASRYSSALGFLQNAVASIKDEPELQEQFKTIRDRADRMQQVVAFYEYSDRHERLNVMSRDTKAITACVSGLQSLGIWDKDDWWFQLPDDDLTAQQQDQLRWDVYQQLMLLDASLVKMAGIRLVGEEKIGGASLFRAARQFISTDAGKREARAALVVSDRVEAFRMAEAARWYRSMAAFRVGMSKRLQGHELGLTKNATDAQCLGVLSMIAGIDPNFGVLFRGYQGDDSLQSAHDALNRSATLRPDHYWTHLSLAQVEYLIAQRKPGHTWRDLEVAVQAIGRCLAIDPTNCFAHADRSNMYREQARLIHQDDSLSAEQKTRRSSELRRWALADAELASRLGVDQRRIGWQYGLALYEVGQVAEALDQFLEASKLTYPLIDIQDAAFLLVDDLRGRQAVSNIIQELSRRKGPDQATLLTLLASTRMNQNQFDAALKNANDAINMADDPSDAPGHAYAVRGMIHMQQDDFVKADADFKQALQQEPDHAWAVYGIARCDEELDRRFEALERYRQAESIAVTNDHRAACLLGQGRSLGFLNEYAKATQTIKQARQLEPACDIMTVVRPLISKYKSLKAADPKSSDTVAMKEFLESLSKLPRVSNIRFPAARTLEGEYQAPLFNGDFELGSSKYWSDTTGAAWLNEAGSRSSATVASEHSHGGQFALHIRGDNIGLGKTGQTFPVPPERICRVVLWAKRTAQVDPSAGPIQIAANGEPLIQFPPSVFDWTQFEGTFQSASGDSFQKTRLEIVAEGSGDIWLDGIQVFVEPKSGKAP